MNGLLLQGVGAPSRAVIDRESAAILQTQPWGQDAIVLYTFQAILDGHQNECIGLLQTRSQLLRLSWQAGSGSSHCTHGSIDNEPIGVAGSSSFNDDQSWSAVYGGVYQEDIATIQVTWEDGLVQQVEAVNQSYLVLRTGTFRMTQIQALNAQKQVIYTHTPAEPAPDKEISRRSIFTVRPS